ncbi:HDOD domain-containing protein [Peristeroidobacter soli]|uniref:HDOD domain-containing protein n=1 Tax=Peristeroidobacter soli TaxID=2497877 RepID=UPI00101B8498|nr:HDOD domain-containing protein [Peristeroidobacter soli]
MKRVLFVDDEPALLDGLRGRLRGLRSRWEMIFVESASRAIAEMELRPVDVLVSDMRMPGMDGAQLLSIVRDRWPETIRIVLSGHAENEQSKRLLTLAHQYLGKPCEENQIESAMERCLQMHELLTDSRMRASVGHLARLPAIPRIFAKLHAALLKPDVCVREVTDIVHEDPAIAAKVLQMVNSAFFRVTRRITRIDQAISYLGFNAIRTAVLSVEVFSLWQPGVIVAGLEPERLQARAHRVAAAVSALSHGTAMFDDALLAGLFYNIGYRVLLQERPEDLARASAEARARDIPLHEAERRVIGASNAEVGAYLLGLWGLPYAVVEAIAFQYEPERSGARQFDVLAALVTAERLVMAEDPLIVGIPHHACAALDDRYLQMLSAPFDWSEAQRRVSTDQTGGLVT